MSVLTTPGWILTGSVAFIMIALMDLNCRDIPPMVVAVRVGDLDGDGMLDLLCKQTPNESGCSSALVAWLSLSIATGMPQVTSELV